MPGAEYYRGLKVLKKFVGRHAKSIVLLDKGIVRKTYSQEHYDVFENEATTLKKLKNCKFIPKLYFVDKERLTIYMAYCGRTLTNLDKYKAKIEKYKKILEKQFKIYHNDIRDGNVCIYKNQIYFIDFGWARNYKGEAGYGLGKIGHSEAGDQSETKVYHKTDLLHLLDEILKSNELKSEYLKIKIKEVLDENNTLEKKEYPVNNEKKETVSTKNTSEIGKRQRAKQDLGKVVIVDKKNREIKKPQLDKKEKVMKDIKKYMKIKDSESESISLSNAVTDTVSETDDHVFLSQGSNEDPLKYTKKENTKKENTKKDSTKKDSTKKDSTKKESTKKESNKDKNKNKREKPEKIIQVVSYKGVNDASGSDESSEGDSSAESNASSSDPIQKQYYTKRKLNITKKK